MNIVRNSRGNLDIYKMLRNLDLGILDATYVSLATLLARLQPAPAQVAFATPPPRPNHHSPESKIFQWLRVISLLQFVHGIQTGTVCPECCHEYSRGHLPHSRRMDARPCMGYTYGQPLPFSTVTPRSVLLNFVVHARKWKSPLAKFKESKSSMTAVYLCMYFDPSPTQQSRKVVLSVEVIPTHPSSPFSFQLI